MFLVNNIIKLYMNLLESGFAYAIAGTIFKKGLYEYKKCKDKIKRKYLIYLNYSNK